MKIQCVVIEDDPIYRQTIADFANKLPVLDVIAVCASALEANVYLVSHKIDLILSDIEMDDLSGLDLMRSLKHPPYVIFITSYPGYAVEGFQVDAVDYLVKPVSFERFVKAINRVQDRIAGSHAPEAPFVPQDDHFFIRVDNQYVRLKYNDVIFIEAYGDFVKVHAADRSYVVLVNLKNMEDQLPSSQFVRSHRSFLVNVQRIDSIDNWEIKAGHATIPLSKNFKDVVYALVVDKKLVRRFGSGDS